VRGGSGSLLLLPGNLNRTRAAGVTSRPPRRPPPASLSHAQEDNSSWNRGPQCRPTGGKETMTATVRSCRTEARSGPGLGPRPGSRSSRGSSWIISGKAYRDHHDGIRVNCTVTGPGTGTVRYGLGLRVTVTPSLRLSRSPVPGRPWRLRPGLPGRDFLSTSHLGLSTAESDSDSESD
jgi:hypothetical protein